MKDRLWVVMLEFRNGYEGIADFNRIKLPFASISYLKAHEMKRNIQETLSKECDWWTKQKFWVSEFKRYAK